MSIIADFISVLGAAHDTIGVVTRVGEGVVVINGTTYTIDTTGFSVGDTVYIVGDRPIKKPADNITTYLV